MLKKISDISLGSYVYSKQHGYCVVGEKVNVTRCEPGPYYTICVVADINHKPCCKFRCVKHTEEFEVYAPSIDDYGEGCYQDGLENGRESGYNEGYLAAKDVDD